MGKGPKVVEAGTIRTGLVWAVFGKGEPVVVIINGVKRVRLERILRPKVGIGGAKAMLEAITSELDLGFELDGGSGLTVSAESGLKKCESTGNDEGTDEEAD